MMFRVDCHHHYVNTPSAEFAVCGFQNLVERWSQSLDRGTVAQSNLATYLAGYRSPSREHILTAKNIVDR